MSKSVAVSVRNHLTRALPIGLILLGSLIAVASPADSLDDKIWSSLQEENRSLHAAYTEAAQKVRLAKAQYSKERELLDQACRGVVDQNLESERNQLDKMRARFDALLEKQEFVRVQAEDTRRLLEDGHSDLLGIAADLPLNKYLERLARLAGTYRGRVHYPFKARIVSSLPIYAKGISILSTDLRNIRCERCRACGTATAEQRDSDLNTLLGEFQLAVLGRARTSE